MELINCTLTDDVMMDGWMDMEKMVLIIKGTVDFCQGHQSKNEFPIHCCRSS